MRSWAVIVSPVCASTPASHLRGARHRPRCRGSARSHPFVNRAPGSVVGRVLTNLHVVGRSPPSRFGCRRTNHCNGRFYVDEIRADYLARRCTKVRAGGDAAPLSSDRSVRFPSPTYLLVISTSSLYNCRATKGAFYHVIAIRSKHTFC